MNKLMLFLENLTWWKSFLMWGTIMFAVFYFTLMSLSNGVISDVTILRLSISMGFLIGLLLSFVFLQIRHDKEFYAKAREIEKKYKNATTKSELQILRDSELPELLNMLSNIGGIQFQTYGRIRDLVILKLEMI